MCARAYRVPKLTLRSVTFIHDVQILPSLSCPIDIPILGWGCGRCLTRRNSIRLLWTPCTCVLRALVCVSSLDGFYLFIFFGITDGHICVCYLRCTQNKNLLLHWFLLRASLISLSAISNVFSLLATFYVGKEPQIRTFVAIVVAILSWQCIHCNIFWCALLDLPVYLVSCSLANLPSTETACEYNEP